MDKDERFHNPIFAQRLEEEMQDWLKEEKKKYKSWNLFFRKLKKDYVSVQKLLKQHLED